MFIIRNIFFQCRHCHETFTSKISFRIHQRKHTEEARRRGTLDGEEPLRPVLHENKPIGKKKKRKPFGRGSYLDLFYFFVILTFQIFISF